jgi:hypothetical protein
VKEPSPTDLVFRLGWLEDPETASSGIKVLQAWVHENQEFCSEADTKPVVEAMLRGLGWDTLGGDVAREGDCNLGDFHLYYEKKDENYRRIAILIEAEPLHYERERLKGEHLHQLNRYVRRLVEAREGSGWISMHRLERDSKVFVCGVLTNGQLWWIYDGPKGVCDTSPLAYPPSLEFDLLKADNLGDLLSVIGKEQVCAQVEQFLKG